MTQKHRKQRSGGKILLLVLLAAAAVWGAYKHDILPGGSLPVTRHRVAAAEREFPLLLQTDPRWGNKAYGDSTVSVSGCGPTCLAMVLTGLTGDPSLTPDKVARFSQEKRYYVKGSGTSWKLMTTGAEQLGLRAAELPLDESAIERQLSEGHPIICSMKKGDFTEDGHFIVLVEYTPEGMIRVNDPNSAERSKKLWTYDRLAPQISILWAYQ